MSDNKFMIPRFTEAEKHIVYEALDLFGFIRINYWTRQNTFNIIFSEREFDEIDGPKAVAYLSERLKGRRWKHMCYEEERTYHLGSDGEIEIMSYGGWGKEN